MRFRKAYTSKFSDSLNQLRKHLKTCEKCRLVTKAVAFNVMCNEGIALCHTMAMQSERLNTLHRKAYADKNGFIYACPDRSKHGEDYAKTAEPHPCVATVVGLF